jgi:hypothetical protein
VRSIIATILVTIIAWAAIASIGFTDKIFTSLVRTESRMKNRDAKEGEIRWTDSKLVKTSHVLNAITPRTEELNYLNEQITYSAFMSGGVHMMDSVTFGDRSWAESLMVSFAWISIFLAISCVWFSLKDY